MKERIFILERIFVGLLLFITLPIQLLLIGISFCGETVLLPLLLVRWIKEGGDFYFGTGTLLTWLQKIYFFVTQEDNGRFLSIIYNIVCWVVFFLYIFVIKFLIL